MAIHAQKEISIKLEQGSWSDEATIWLGLATKKQYLPALRYQVDQHIAMLFYAWVDGEICGAFVLRIDYDGANTEGVIVAASGAVFGVDLIASCLPEIEKKFNGCQSIRYHTNKPAVARKMRNLDYQVDEIICRKMIQNGKQ
ncbi:MAG: hypothetical protein WBJ21_02865 [Burkholderiaceae bacterium]